MTSGPAGAGAPSLPLIPLGSLARRSAPFDVRHGSAGATPQDMPKGPKRASAGPFGSPRGTLPMETLTTRSRSVQNVMAAAISITSHIEGIASVNCDAGPFPQITLHLTDRTAAGNVADRLGLKGESFADKAGTHTTYRGQVDGVEVLLFGVVAA